MTYIHGCGGVPVGTVYNFKYNGTNGSDGSAQSWTTPCTGKFKLEVWGAEGGYGSDQGRDVYDHSMGGNGGYSVGIINLGAGTVLYAVVGGHGSSCWSGNKVEGGYNGGGSSFCENRADEPGSSGGGGTDFRIKTNSLYARVIVAGGGGGGGEEDAEKGGAGGGVYGGGMSSIANGKYATNCSSTVRTDAKSAACYGSPTSGGYSAIANETTSTGITGAFGIGGHGYGSGGGGGGWYGGAPSHNGASYYVQSGSDGDGGGGGSGYVYTSSTANQYPSGCLLSSSYYLTNASTTWGGTTIPAPSGGTETGHEGDGHARITIVE